MKKNNKKIMGQEEISQSNVKNNIIILLFKSNDSLSLLYL